MNTKFKAYLFLISVWFLLLSVLIIIMLNSMHVYMSDKRFAITGEVINIATNVIDLNEYTKIYSGTRLIIFRYDVYKNNEYGWCINVYDTNYITN